MLRTDPITLRTPQPTPMNIKHQIVIEADARTAAADTAHAPGVPDAHVRVIQTAVRQLLGEQARVLRISPAYHSDRPSPWVIAGRRAAMGPHAPAGW